MSKNFAIQSRVSEENKIFLYQYCTSKKIKMSDFILKSCLEFIKNNPSPHTDEKMVVERLKQEQSLETAREEQTKQMHNIYFIKNTLRQLYDIVRTSLINSKGEDFGLESIKIVLKNAKNVFNNFSKVDKKALKKQFKELGNWKLKEYAYNQIKFMNFIKRGEIAYKK